MHRYYISFSHQSHLGLGIASLDVITATRITTVDDLDPVYAQLAQRGYTNNVKILAFSLYANPTNTPAANPQNTPAPTQQSRRRRSHRPGRPS